MSRNALHDVFLAFCSFGANRQAHAAELDSGRFMKLCRDCDLLCRRFTRTDADLLFTRVKPAGERRIDWPTFRDAVLEEIAARKGVTRGDVAAHLRHCAGPRVRTASLAPTTELSGDLLYARGVPPQPHPHPTAARLRSSTASGLPRGTGKALEDTWGREWRQQGDADTVFATACSDAATRPGEAAEADAEASAALRRHMQKARPRHSCGGAGRSPREYAPHRYDPARGTDAAALQPPPPPLANGTGPSDLAAVLADMVAAVGALDGKAGRRDTGADSPRLHCPDVQGAAAGGHLSPLGSARQPLPSPGPAPRSLCTPSRRRSPSPSARSRGALSATGMAVGSIEEPLHGARLPGRIGRVLPWESPNWRSAPSVPPGNEGSPPRWRPGGRAPPPGLRWSGSGGLTTAGGRHSGKLERSGAPSPAGVRSSTPGPRYPDSPRWPASPAVGRPFATSSCAPSAFAASGMEVGSTEEPLQGSRLPGRIGRVLPWESPNWRSAPSPPPGQDGSPPRWRPSGRAPPPGMRWSGSGGLMPVGGRG